MPGIELSDAIYRRLLRRSTSFGDSAEDVIQRLLDLTEGRSELDAPPPEAERNRGSRARPGSILPEREYWRPILGIIVESGGAAPANDVIDALGPRIRSQLTPGDLEVLPMGEVRWRNRARFARLRMKERGLLRADSHRGIWEVSDLGRRYLEGDDGAADGIDS